MGGRIARTFGLAVLALIASAGLTWGVGRLVLPEQSLGVSDPAISSGTRVPAPSLDEVQPSSSLFDRGLALIAVNGDLKGRYSIGDQWRSLSDDGRFTVAFGRGQDRLVVIGAVAHGRPDVIASLRGVTFYATNGECEAEIVEFKDLEPSFDPVAGTFGGPRGAGEIMCKRVEARTGEVISMDIAFRFDQVWCGSTANQCP